MPYTATIICTPPSIYYRCMYTYLYVLTHNRVRVPQDRKQQAVHLILAKSFDSSGRACGMRNLRTCVTLVASLNSCARWSMSGSVECRYGATAVQLLPSNVLTRFTHGASRAHSYTSVDQVSQRSASHKSVVSSMYIENLR
jgi:hypothetical protein